MRRVFAPAAVGLAGVLLGLGCTRAPSENSGLGEDGGTPSEADVSEGFGDVGSGRADAGGEPGSRDGGVPGEVLDCAMEGWTRPAGRTFSEAYQDVICHRLTCGPCSIDGSRSPPFTGKEACFEHVLSINTLVYENFSRQYDNPELFAGDESELDRCLGRIQTCARPSVLEETCPELDNGRLGLNACCDHRGGCGPGLACVGRTSASTGTCQARKGIGELCTGDAFVTADCQVGLRCVRGFCRELVSVGGACTESFECTDGLVCSGERCAAGQSAGESCEALSCSLGLFCPEGQCEPWRDEGEGCRGQTAFGLSDGGCKLGLFCREDTNVCARLPTRGEPCEDARACRYPSRDFCNLSVDGRQGSGVCQTRHAVGDDCLGQIPNMCSQGSLCIGGTCRQALDEPLCR